MSDPIIACDNRFLVGLTEEGRRGNEANSFVLGNLKKKSV